MTCHDSLEHKIVRNLVSTCLDHYYLFSRACNCKVKSVLSSLLKSWVENEFAVNVTYVDRCNWAVPWNIRDRKCNRCSYHTCDLR